VVDVFDEVEEELRNERYKALLQQWGPWVGGAAAAVVLGVGAYQFTTWSTTQQANAASDHYQSAAELYEAGDTSTADAQFTSLAEEGPNGYATLALMRRGDIALQNGDRAEAARFYGQAAERSPEPLTRDLARYQAALAQFDTLSFDDLRLRLEPLTEGAAPVGLLARELIAAAALRDERWDEARDAYTALSFSLDVPPGMSQRIVEATAFINARAPQVAEPPAEAAPADTAASDTASATPDTETGVETPVQQEEDGQ